MALWGDDRGAAVQVGVAILLAFVVLAITTYQVEVVPNQNEEIEFNHNQDVQDQLQELRNDVVGVSDGRSGASRSITLGTGYPARTIFINPGPAAGTLQTTDPGDGEITLDNANATSGAQRGTQDYWDETETWNTSTRALEYDIRYNVYQSAPVTVYEHSALYNDNPNDAKTSVADQLLVEDDEITLVALQGDLRESRVGSVSVRTRALSRTANTVPIENATDEVMTLTVPTDRTEFWNETFHDAGFTATENDDNVTVEFDSNETYDLRMAQVGVGDVTRDSPAERAEYIVEVDNRAPTVVAEVRDQFNNPVRNFENVSLTDGSDGELESDRTNSQGRIRVSNVEGGDTVELEIFDGGEEFEELSIDVEGGGGGGGGGAAYEVNWNQDKIEAENNNVDECNGDCEITGSAGDDAELFMGTSPTADGANVDFSVSDQSVGTVDPNSETTDSDGEASTMFEIDSGAEASESVTVFTSSGGDGDQLTMALNLTDEGVGGTVVFTSANDNEIRTVAEQDSVINVGQEADVIGPLTSDLDRDEEEKIPYVDGNELRLVAADGTGDELLVDPSGPDGVNPFNGVSLLAVGRWDGAPMSVYFVGNNEETIYRHDEDMDTGDAIEVVEPENGVGAVVGIADVTGNGTDELVYADGSQELRYIGAGSGDSPTGTVMTDDIGENNGIGVGRPADFNGDGSARVPVVDGDDRLVLASDDGSTEFVTDELVTKSPVAPIDWDGDGNLEIVFAADNDTIQYVDNPLETPSVRTASDEEEPREETGIT